MFRLDTPVTSLTMVGPVYAGILKKLEIFTLEDLLYHLPFRYENYSIISKISTLQKGEKVSVICTVKSIKNIFTKSGKKVQKAILSDETGEIEAIWYNQPYIINILKSGTKISIAGQVELFGNKPVFQFPDYEVLKFNKPLIHSGRLVPVYPETAGVTSKWLRSRIAVLLFQIPILINEFLPGDILKNYGLVGEKEALALVHFPKNPTEVETGRKRLAFNELLFHSINARKEQERIRKITTGYKFNTKKYSGDIDAFISDLPFTLTQSQKKCVTEILSDLSCHKPMNRILEGDVGSGKTVVAGIAIYIAYLSGYQSVFMAPTQILAAQHRETLTKLLSPYGMKISYITGGVKKQKGKEENNLSDLTIGTHAILGKKVKFSKLGLVVIDEQQRFGVTQRALLKKKGKHPHLLSLTATPIPRTIALTIFSDLNLSVIDELPRGRKIIKTWVVPREKRNSAYNWIRKELLSRKPFGQAFIICPFIEPSESLTTVKAATEEFQRLRKTVYPDLKLRLLHGRLKPLEKEKILDDFKKGKFHILISTPVVEVGIDIPSAIIMMIEGADRYGLSQLHQLRGRIGRGNDQSYCLLFSDSQLPGSIERLKLLEKTAIGPKLAELDLKLRGPGDIYGTRQHGIPNLKIADFSDIELIQYSKKAVEYLIKDNFSLSHFPLLRERLKKYKIENIAMD